MDKEQTYQALQNFQKAVVKQSRSNLTRLKKNSSRALYESIKGTVKVNQNSFELDFEMLPYGQFQDKGVNGVGPAGKDRNGNTKQVVKDGKFRFGSGSGPAGGLTRGIDKWMIRRGIAPRDKNGKFVSRKSLKFLIARSIFRHGIKPSLFFTKPFEKEYKKLGNDLIEAYGLDLEGLLEFSLEKLK